MRRALVTTAVVGLAASTIAVGPASAVEIGDQGCTPGYWKQSQHFDSWEESKPDRLLSFDPPSLEIPAFANTSNDLDRDGVPDTFLAALSFKGGSGLVGAERILMRAATAAWLNAANEGLGYPLRRKDFVPKVNAAISSGDRATMLSLASELDALNNSLEGCPLN